MTKHNQKDKLTQEIAIHRSLNNKNVVGFHGFFEDNQNVYIVLELCRRRVCMYLNFIIIFFLYMHFYLITFYFAEKTKYMFMPREKYRKNHNIKIGDKLSECVAKLKNLGTILINQKCLQEEIKSGLDSRKMLLFTPESFVFWFATQKYED